MDKLYGFLRIPDDPEFDEFKKKIKIAPDKKVLVAPDYDEFYVRIVERGGKKTYLVPADWIIYDDERDPIWDIAIYGDTTVVFWKDGSKTNVTCQKGNTFDKDKGILLCFMKKMCGNTGCFNNFARRYIFDDAVQK